jgi:hypothetical protein
MGAEFHEFGWGMKVERIALNAIAGDFFQTNALRATRSTLIKFTAKTPRPARRPP